MTTARNGRTMGRAADAGFTLLEVMIVTAVMGLVIAAISAAIVNANRAYVPNVTRTNLEAAAGSMAEKLTEELTHALPLTVSADGTEVRFCLPVDGDGSGSPLDIDGNIELGYGHNAGYMRRIRYVVDLTIDEAIVKRDINNDGSRTDRFFVGRLVADTLDETGAPMGNDVALGPAVILATSPDAGLDVDGDGVDDRIFARTLADGTFSANGPILRVRLVQGRLDDNYYFHVTARTVFIRLRNL
jgi:prepilin-type N-terminal cleavage/methylation domain-containing protein